MMRAPVVRDVLLLGGGHSHALVVRRWGMRPVPGIRLRLVSRDVLTPYSGMLPGYLAGHYTGTQIHMDLSRLCRWAGVDFIEATVIGLDTAKRRVLLSARPALDYDVLSIDTGGTPDLTSTPGVGQWAVPVKPIHRLQERWELVLQRLSTGGQLRTVAVVGGGAGGFELLLAVHFRLTTANYRVRMTWVLRGRRPLADMPAAVQTLALGACRERGIDVLTDFNVVSVMEHGLTAADGRSISTDEVFWCTAVVAAEWPAAANLAVDDGGFIATNEFLQSVSHPDIFAAGDIATQIAAPRAKAGVFAVRQAPVLYDNLLRHCLSQRLRRYRPQRHFLSLLALGRRSGIATRGRWSVSGDWVWRWKDRIDQRFMDQFTNLARTPMLSAQQRLPEVLRQRLTPGEAAPFDLPRCGGCGAKVPSHVLRHVLDSIPIRDASVLVGLEQSDDIALIRHQDGLLAQSVDQLRGMLGDLWQFGRIVALHALNDLFASGATARSAQALVTLPYALDTIQQGDLQQIMAGLLHELDAHDCVLIGGHTGEAADLSVGLVVNGIVAEHALVRKRGIVPGHALILTKPLGSGIIMAADMQARVDGVVVRECLRHMLQSQRRAGEILVSCGASAMTDVTGFALLGHLGEMLGDAPVGVALETGCIPVMNGVIALAEQGVSSTLYPSNRRFRQSLRSDQNPPEALLRVLCDPQTSGGLLAAVPATRADACVSALHDEGYPQAAVIGYASSAPGVMLT